jgi:hypothetical protein
MGRKYYCLQATCALPAPDSEAFKDSNRTEGSSTCIKAHIVIATPRRVT